MASIRSIFNIKSGNLLLVKLLFFSYFTLEFTVHSDYSSPSKPFCHWTGYVVFLKYPPFHDLFSDSLNNRVRVIWFSEISFLDINLIPSETYSVRHSAISLCFVSTKRICSRRSDLSLIVKFNFSWYIISEWDTDVFLT